MSGTIDYLLDTNYVLGLLKGDPNLASEKDRLQSSESSYAVSVITRIELLGYPDLTSEEERKINRFLGFLQRIPLSETIENRAIGIRRQRKIKIPDAIILATALEHSAELLTLDERLKSVFAELEKGEETK